MPLVRRLGSRALCTGLLALACTATAVLLAPVAQGQTTAAPGASAAALRAEADALSSKYFAALDRVQSLDDDIARSQQLVDDLNAQAKQARANARTRALIAYTSSGAQLTALVDGNDTLDAARRAHLIDQVNERDQNVYERLHDAVRALHKQQRVLRETRQAQAGALATLKDQGAAIDAKLAQAVQQEQVAQAAVALAAAPATTPTTGTEAPAAAASTTTTTTTQPAPSTPPAPPYSGTPGENPHHNDPFLSCVRRRESSGNYGAVNPSGPYLGAYQFLQSTWNVTASHAGRPDLVGVPANTASQYDQDEMAWSLYQWQGTGPWGGSC